MTDLKTLGLAAAMLACGSLSAQQLATEQFLNPTEQTRVIAWWHWVGGNISRQGITRDLEAMQRAGIEQATILNVQRDMPGVVEERVLFNTPQWWDMLRFAMQEARRLGMTLGAANCDGWSESGGPWITAEQSMKHYVWTATHVEGDGRHEVTATLPQPKAVRDFYRDVRVMAYPTRPTIDPSEVRDVTALVDLTGELRWKAPKGQWTVLRFGYTTTGKTNNPATWEGRGLECDKMDTTALNWHFENYPQKIVDLSREVGGDVFRYFLVDSWEAGPQTWTQNLPHEFRQRRGYDLMPWLPALCGQQMVSQQHTDALLHDFRMTLGDMVNDYYFKHMSELCHRRGLQLYSEGIYGEPKNPPVDVLKTYQYSDVPMTEFWARIPGHEYPFTYNPWPSKTFIYPVHSSLLYGKTVIGSEAYTAYAIYSDSPSDLKTYGDVAFAEGVNSMMLHSYVHQPDESHRPGLTLGVYGQSFNRHNTWWEESRTFFDEQARAQYLLRQGVRMSDVLVYTGDELPCPQWTPEQSDSAMQGLKFNYINPDVLLTRVTARDGQLWLDGRYAFQALVVRDTLMELPTLRQLAAWADQGIRIVGPKPTRTLSLTGLEQNNRELTRLANRVWQLPNVTSDIRQLPALVRPEFVSHNDNVVYQHRQGEGMDLYFVVNKSYTETLQLDAACRVTGRQATLWDPLDGTVSAVPAAMLTERDGYTTLPLTLAPQQSMFIVMADAAHAVAAPTRAADGWQTYGPWQPQHRWTMAESADGTMHFDDDARIADRPIGTFRSLTESDEEAVRHYSGRVTYTIPVQVTPQMLKPGRRLSVEIPAFGSTARVEMNGHVVTTLWMPGSRADLSPYAQVGRNVLTIVVTNPWRNRMIGDCKEGFEPATSRLDYDATHGGAPRTWTSSPTTLKLDPVPVINAQAQLIPSGISQGLILAY